MKLLNDKTSAQKPFNPEVKGLLFMVIISVIRTCPMCVCKRTRFCCSSLLIHMNHQIRSYTGALAFCSSICYSLEDRVPPLSQAVSSITLNFPICDYIWVNVIAFLNYDPLNCDWANVILFKSNNIYLLHFSNVTIFTLLQITWPINIVYLGWRNNELQPIRNSDTCTVISITGLKNWTPLHFHHCCQIILNTLRPRQNGRHFADDTFNRIFVNENVRISINISLKFVPKGLINNIPELVQIMAWRWPGDKPLSEPMTVSLLTYICVTRPQWVTIWLSLPKS